MKDAHRVARVDVVAAPSPTRGPGSSDADVLRAPERDLGLLVAGGLLYSLGVVVHLATRLPFHNALWHALVLAAAACHCAVVLRLAAAAAG